MLSTKERIFGFLVILLCMSILFCSAPGYCVTLKGRVLKTNNDDLEKALVFVCDYEAAKTQGIQATVNIVGLVAISINNNNLVSPKGESIVLDERSYPLDREYLLGFATLQDQQTENYPSFFLGSTTETNLSNPGNYVKKTKWWDVDDLPRVRFTSGTFNLGTVIAPGTGVWFRGIINDENGDPLTDVGVELYYDSNGKPAKIPFPFTRFDRTGEPNSQGLNFQIGGVLKNTPYYIKLIASNTGYLDTFVMDDTNPDEPRLFSLTGNFHLDDPPYNLTERGAKIQGYIQDKDNNPVTDTIISIQGLSDNEDNPYPVYYVIDPNYDIYESLTEIDKYLRRVEPYYYNFDGTDPSSWYNKNTGWYEIKGLPYEDHDYYLSAVEVPGGGPKVFATPNWYDGTVDGAFDINDAHKISLAGPGDTARVDFKLNDGACITGNIGIDVEVGASVKTVLEDRVPDPNVFNVDKIVLVTEALKVDSYGKLSPIPYGGVQTMGIGPYELCGLPPLEYIMMCYAANGFYPPKYWDGTTTGTNIPLTAEIIDLEFGSTETGKDINLALGGMIKGRVKNSEGQNIEGASVVVNQVNLGNPLVGYFFVNSEGAPLAQYSRETDPNGIFYFWGLPEGLYTIFVNGLFDEDTGYKPKFYTDDNRNTMIANQTTPIFVENNNPDFMSLNDFQLLESDTSGGIISGNISLSSNVSNLVTLSSNTFYLRLFKADIDADVGFVPGIEISNPLYQFDDPVDNTVPYQIMVPDFGDYFLSFQDKDLKLVPHFYRAGGTTVDYNEASTLTISDSDPLLEGKNVVLSKKSGRVSGEVLDDSTNEGISGIIVHASQEIKGGPQKGTWRSVRQAETDSNGEFILEGLYEGTYIFSITDPDSIYAPRYYSTATTGQDPYTPDNADTWNYDSDNPDNPYYSIRVQKGGSISGRVDNRSLGAKIYTYMIKEGNTVSGYSVTADPNFLITGLIPGNYILGFKDPNFNYVPEYYSQSGFTRNLDLDDSNFYITVNINETTEVAGEMNFTQLGAKIEGQIKQETGAGPDPMSNTYVFLYHLSEKELWATTPAQFTATDSEGNYSFKGLSKGNYKIIAFGPQYRPISEFVPILESDLGSAMQVDVTFPSYWPDTNQKHDKTLELEQGLNLIAYPTRIPPYVTGYTSLSLLKDIVMVSSREGMTLKTFSHYDNKWKTASFGKTELDGLLITDVHGNSYSVSNGKGYLLYSKEGPTINFRYFPGQTSLWLKEGINMVGNVAFKADQADINDPNFTPDPDFTTRKMLSKMGEDSSVSIQTFEAGEGKWQATYWMWGKSAGKDTEIKDELGYIVTMKEEVNNWYPTDNN